MVQEKPLSYQGKKEGILVILEYWDIFPSQFVLGYGLRISLDCCFISRVAHGIYQVIYVLVLHQFHIRVRIMPTKNHAVGLFVIPSLSERFFTLVSLTFLDGVQLAASPNSQRCINRLEKNVEEEMDSWYLKDDSISQIVAYLEGKIPSDFERKIMSF